MLSLYFSLGILIFSLFISLKNYTCIIYAQNFGNDSCPTSYPIYIYIYDTMFQMVRLINILLITQDQARYTFRKNNKFDFKLKPFKTLNQSPLYLNTKDTDIIFYIILWTSNEQKWRVISNFIIMNKLYHKCFYIIHEIIIR